jgi:beta-galactosidase
VPGGENQLAIRLDNPPDFSCWYPGAGFYRNGWLAKTQPVHVGHWGTYLTTPEVSREHATVNLKVTVANDSKQPANVSVVTEIFLLDANGRRTGSVVSKIAPTILQISSGQSGVAEGSTLIANPKLWGPPPTQQPNRYLAVTTVSQDGKVVDRYKTHFGIRKIECRTDGLYVNGEHIRIQGVNRHDDLGALGTAFNERAAERQLQELRNMGCNAIRIAHDPPRPNSSN